VIAVRGLALEQDKLNASWEVGAQKALTAYLETARNTAKQFEGAFTTSFALIEDGLTRFITTGNADMRQFATAIIQQFARIAVAKTVSGFAGMMFGGGGGNGNFQPGEGYMGGGGFAWNAKGDVYNSPSLSAYSGQVHSTPQAFTFAKGAGIFGEAGPEAIMPLSRDSQGRLGVKAEGGTGGGNAINITMNIDATGGKTQGDAGAAGDLGRKLEGAVRGVLLAEMRPGGLLAA
jgi:lambda family phage tail tape measure protein